MVKFLFFIDQELTRCPNGWSFKLTIHPDLCFFKQNKTKKQDPKQPDCRLFSVTNKQSVLLFLKIAMTVYQNVRLVVLLYHDDEVSLKNI